MSGPRSAKNTQELAFIQYRLDVIERRIDHVENQLLKGGTENKEVVQLLIEMIRGTSTSGYNQRIPSPFPSDSDTIPSPVPPSMTIPSSSSPSPSIEMKDNRKKEKEKENKVNFDDLAATTFNASSLARRRTII
jgi:hypothetical protein